MDDWKLKAHAAVRLKNEPNMYVSSNLSTAVVPKWLPVPYFKISLM